MEKKRYKDMNLKERREYHRQWAKAHPESVRKRSRMNMLRRQEKARKAGIRYIMRTRLTDDDKEYIVENSGKMRVRDIAEWIGCHVCTVRKIAKRAGCRYRTSRHWTVEETVGILAMWNDMKSYDAIAEKYGIEVEKVPRVVNNLSRRRGMKRTRRINFINERKKWERSDNG